MNTAIFRINVGLTGAVLVLALTLAGVNFSQAQTGGTEDPPNFTEPGAHNYWYVSCPDYIDMTSTCPPAGTPTATTTTWSGPTTTCTQTLIGSTYYCCEYASWTKYCYDPANPRATWSTNGVKEVFDDDYQNMRCGAYVPHICG